ncbi:aconitase X [Thermodesulfobacteriota bacterium]
MTSIRLTDEEKKMLNGDFGSGVQQAMTLLTRFGAVFGAERMVPVDAVHLSTQCPRNLLRKMTEGVDTAKTLCSLHAAFDPSRIKEIGISEIKTGQFMATGATLDSKVFQEQLEIFSRLGFLKTFTCAPYLVGIIPKHGDVVILTGSSGQIISNSLFGARANREAVPSALASVVTGKTPETGLLKKKNRYAKILVELEGLNIEGFTDAHYGALGYFIGGVAGLENIAISGLNRRPSFESLRLLMSPMPVSGGVTMCHIAGLTPESPTLEQAFGGAKPIQSVKAGKKELQDAWEQLHTADSREVDHVAIGCPHCTIFELGEIASILDGKKLSENVSLLIGVGKPVVTLAEQMGYADIIIKAGGIFSPCCVGPSNPRVYLGDTPLIMATNSAKAAHYIVRGTEGKTKILYGSLRTCIETAITGKWVG